MNTKVQQWGNSLAVRIPKRVAEALDLREGSSVTVTPSKDGIYITPQSDDTNNVKPFKDWEKAIIPMKGCKKVRISEQVDEIVYGASR